MKSENPKGLGLRRDNAILKGIEEWQALDTEQVRALYFSNIVYGNRKAQDRLLKMNRAGKINRCKTQEGFYAYYLDKKPGQLSHLLATNWVRLWFMKTLPSWEILHSWSYEQDYGILRCDGFASMKNPLTGKFRFVFLETDMGTNVFDKIEKYNKLYSTPQKYENRWWVPLTQRFPSVLIVTVQPTRKRAIQGLIEAKNINGLEFQIKLLDEIRREALSKCCSVKQSGLEID